MEYVIVALAAFFSSALTLFSGFGLGTLLLPAFAVFFPNEVAVAATAIVHAANNLLKVALLGQKADRSIVLRFGIPAIISSFAGAALLVVLATGSPLHTYQIGSMRAAITPLNLVLALLMLGFAALEILPQFAHLQFDRKYLPVGGILSGFFGGVSGHQGALRSAFLAKSGLTTHTYIATNAVIALLVDFIRIAVYALAMAGGSGFSGGLHWPLVFTGMIAAFSGVIVGKRYIHKVTMRWVQVLTGVLLALIAFALGAGII